MVPSVIVAVMLYTLFVLASAGLSKSGVEANVNAPPVVNAKSPASSPARVVLKVGVVPSASKPVRVATASVPSATENASAEVNTGAMSFTFIKLTVISWVVVLVPSDAVTTTT